MVELFSDYFSVLTRVIQGVFYQYHDAFIVIGVIGRIASVFAGVELRPLIGLYAPACPVVNGGSKV
jgi:hypothetical protein